MKFFSEFKEFIMRGNVVDMAVGVIVGNAFKSIVDSLVQDIVMPCIGMLTGKVDISQLSLSIGDNGLVIPYGNFLQQILNFLIIAFAIFCTIKMMNSLRDRFAKKEEAAEVTSGPTQEELLAEIRDLIKEKN